MDERSARPAAAFALRPTPPKKPHRPSSGSAPTARQPAPPSALIEPTILLVGADSAFEPALRDALARHRVYVETTTPDGVAEAVIAAAPDLVLLVGAAARDGGSTVLEKLLGSAACSAIPVAILDDNTALDMRLRAFRHGAAAVIAPSASIDAIAEQVAKLAREIPERGADSIGVVGEATLSEFVGTLSRELRSGILSVHTGKGNEDAVRLVLGSGRPLAALIDEFVRQVKSHVVHAEPLHDEFAEHAGGTLTLLDPSLPMAEPERVSVKAAASLRPAPGELAISTSLRPPAPAVTRSTQALSGRAGTGISLTVALFLVVLAALQGLLVVGALSLLLKPQRPKSAPGGSTRAAAQSQPASLAAPVSAARDPEASGQASPEPATTQPTAGTPPDESGSSAPSCEQTFGETKIKTGEYPGAAYGQVREANRALVQGDLDAAQRALCKAVLWNQSNPALPLELAQLMLLRRDGVQAVEWARKGLLLDPASARGQGILGDGLARVGDYEPAKRAWLAALHLEASSDPQQFKALSFSSVREARASLKRRDYARAERFFRRAVVLDGDNVAASSGLAEALLKLGDANSALRWANRSVSVAPRDPAARLMLGDVLSRRGDRRAAEVEWREALQLDPSNHLAKRRVSRLESAR